MARQYAINGLTGLKGGVVTYVDGEQVAPGNALPLGTSVFTLAYWYFPTPADIAAGAPEDVKLQVQVEDIPRSASNQAVVNAIISARAERRNNSDWPVLDEAGDWTQYQADAVAF
jgi:hypothetical protein